MSWGGTKLQVSNYKEFRRTGTVTGASFFIKDRTVLYCIGTVRDWKNDFWYGNIPYRAVLGISERGAVPYGNELERTGTIDTNYDMFVLSTVDSESSSDLLTIIGDIELI